jgi:division protein CdvB (Snf7/Vps24/ESCRT-III family)
MDDALDAVFEDDDEEVDGVVDQVFTELGLEDAAGLSTVAAGTGQIAEPQVSTMDDDLERRLAALTSPG